MTRRKLLKLLAATLGGAAALRFLNDSGISNKRSFIDISEVKAQNPMYVDWPNVGLSTTQLLADPDLVYLDIFYVEHYQNGNAIVGKSNGGIGIKGSSTNDIGVKGESTWNYAIRGLSTNYTAVSGETASGFAAVEGINTIDGVGVQGFGNVTATYVMEGIGVRGVGLLDGVRGKSDASTGNGVGVQGFGNVSETNGDAGTGVRGVGSNIGVKGESTNGIAVKAESASGTALYVDGRAYAEGDVGDNGVIEGHHIGTTGEGKGVIGTSIDKFGMVGISDNWDGIRGRSLATSGNGVGVQGFAGDILESNGPYGTGVRGVGSRDGMRGNSRASSGNGVGVQGFGNVVEDDGPAGTGVRGVGSNIGVKAESPSGTALHVEGRSFFKSAGKGMFNIGEKEKIVTVPSEITIGDNSAILVTLNDDSSNIFVLWAKKETTNSFRIRLSGKARDAISFGYLIIDGNPIEIVL